MKIVKNRVARNVKGSGIKTVIKGIRAEQEFWDACDKMAARQKTTRNELIIRVMSRYCRRFIENL
jgi:predicted DNA-binding ribbon-helix-helix protein